MKNPERAGMMPHAVTMALERSSKGSQGTSV